LSKFHLLYKGTEGGVKIFSSLKHNLFQQFPYSPSQLVGPTMPPHLLPPLPKSSMLVGHEARESVACAYVRAGGVHETRQRRMPAAARQAVLNSNGAATRICSTADVRDDGAPPRVRPPPRIRPPNLRRLDVTPAPAPLDPGECGDTGRAPDLVRPIEIDHPPAPPFISRRIYPGDPSGYRAVKPSPIPIHFFGSSLKQIPQESNHGDDEVAPAGAHARSRHV
jgi:hypothetical protein